MKPTVLVAAAAAVLFGSTLRAQCANVWLPGDPRQGPDGPVEALAMWDPDGAGPLTPRLVVGGMFDAAGGAVANRIAAWDPASNTWQAIGSGLWPMRIDAVHALPNGDLIAGGFYPGLTSLGGIARWNGSTWSALGTGLWYAVSLCAVTSLPNGDLIAGGAFVGAGTIAANNVARWDGVSWSPLGAGVSSRVNALLTMPNGDVIAGGNFATAGGAPANAVARWNGASWSPMGSGLTGVVDALALLPNGDVVAGGSFTFGGAVWHGVAHWNGTTWTSLGSAFNLGGEVYALHVMPNGDVIAGGMFTSLGGTPAINVARWNGVSWSAIAGGVHHPAQAVSSLARLTNGDLVAGTGVYYSGSELHYLLRWDGIAWSPLGVGNDGPVFAFTKLSNGDVVAGGRFTTIGATSANRVARWNGSVWSPLGGGISGYYVQALVAQPGGGMVAGGAFTQAGGVAASNVARWDGAAWSPLGAGTDGRVLGLAVLANGDIVAVGEFSSAGGTAANNVARWNGTSWAPLGGGLTSSSSSPYPAAYAAAVLPNGDLVVGGQFPLAGGVLVNNVARWNGVSWSPLGTGVNGAVYSLLTMPNGDVLAGGDSFSSPHGVWRWDGITWSELGPVPPLDGAVGALALLPNGDVVAGGSFWSGGGTLAYRVARWSGSAWSPMLPPSMIGTGGLVPPIVAMTMGSGGTLIVGGSFTIVGGAVSAYVAQVTTTCPATVIPFGASCPSSAGPMALAATSLPWLGSTFTATATGMPASSIALAVTGFGTASLPLSSILPQGGAGCFLWTTPDIVVAVLPTAGSVSTQLAIPNQPALIGQVFHHQVVPVELAPTGGLLAVTSTNRLTALIGVF